MKHHLQLQQKKLFIASKKNRLGADVSQLQQGLQQSNYASATRPSSGPFLIKCHMPEWWSTFGTIYLNIRPCGAVISYSRLIYLPFAVAISGFIRSLKTARIRFSFSSTMETP
ncbi:hypothetical protein AVEN_73126-1 [Araneus ventricosus]|uniref:Uncharacterized protein n=1 Tax=Araneus ventricosus TaxID=182803 RepID=A0A4Y2LY33_ARAVE|nr:hypothetical protein AVEN_73126-1 [Araneus ventricosus]